jgi:hypothetical protein
MNRLFLAGPILFFATLATPASARNPFGADQTPDEPAEPEPAPKKAPPPDNDDASIKPLLPKQPPRPLALRLDGGYAVRRLFSLGVTGADLGFALGVQPTKHMAVWGTGRVELGSTDNGLKVWSTRIGPEIEAVFDPLRIGVGVSLLVMGVGRAQEDETLLSYGGEARFFARLDCVRNDDYALFVRAGLDAGVEVSAGSAFWGPTIGVGFELGVRGKRPPEWSAPLPPPAAASR